MFKMPHVSFFLRSNNDHKQTHVLYCRVRINNTVSEFSLKEKIEPGQWDLNKQCLKGRSSQAKYILALTDSLKYRIKSLSLVKNVNTANALVQELNKPRRIEPMLKEVVKEYIDEVKKVVSSGTLRNHLVKLDNLLAYECEKNKDFSISNFDIKEAERFKKWFMSRANTSNVDTANRNVLFFRSALLNAQKRGDIKNFGLLHFRGEKDRVKDPVFLTIEELQSVKQLNFSSPMLTKIRDLFLFQCCTGLSYADLWGSWSVQEKEFGKVIIGKRTKSKGAYIVPLCSCGIEILDKYNWTLPKYTNEVFNRILKEIAMLANIDKKITTHTGRKTFATLKDSEGYSRETISKMLGHRSIKTTETFYIGESFSRVENELKARKAS